MTLKLNVVAKNKKKIEKFGISEKKISHPWLSRLVGQTQNPNSLRPYGGIGSWWAMTQSDPFRTCPHLVNFLGHSELIN